MSMTFFPLFHKSEQPEPATLLLHSPTKAALSHNRTLYFSHNPVTGPYTESNITYF